MHVTHRRLRSRAPKPESSRANQPNNTDLKFGGLLPSAINGGDLLALVPELAADGEPRLAIDPLLLARKLLSIAVHPRPAPTTR